MPPTRFAVAARCVASTLAALCLAALSGNVIAGQEGCPAERENALQEQAQRQLVGYARALEAMEFTQLDSGDWPGAVSGLELLLGHQPTVLDYEHPPELAADLRDVTLARIGILLQQDLPCATLFARGEQALVKRPRVCVLTLSPCAVAASDAVATGFLLDLLPTWTELIPADNQLQADLFLAFIVDHEVFHCLDSHYHGGQPRGYASHWGEYWRLRSEMAADAFAIAMHLRRARGGRRFVDNLARIRGLALQLGDPQHFTYDAIERMRQTPPEELARLSLPELVSLARDIAAEQLPDYQGFMRFWATAHRAMEVLAVATAETGNQPPPEDAAIDAGLLGHMLDTSRRLDAELFAP